MAILDAAALERVIVDALNWRDDATLIDEPDWIQLTSPSQPEPNFNGVYLARLDPGEVEERIDALRRHYAEHEAGFRWFVGPSSRPLDLSERLERAGIGRTALSIGMHREVPPSLPPTPVGLDIRLVGFDEVELHARVAAQGYGRGPEFAELCVRVMRSALERGDGRLPSWIAFEEGRAIAVSRLCILGPIGYLQGCAVIPEARGRGVYRALIDHRLAVLRELGIDHAVVWADAATSAGSCRRAGFVEVCRAAFHEHRVGPR